jgi:hypothetical protein
MRHLWLILLVGCGKGEPSAPTASPSPPERLPFLEIADFEYKERMDVPAKVKAWHGKNVIVTGYINPVDQVRGLKSFLLVKDSGSCCYGALPKFNHFIQVTLKEGATVDYTRDPVTVQGVLEVGEKWDGDWLECIFTMKDAVKVP